VDTSAKELLQGESDALDSAGHADYDERRVVFNAMIDKRPRAIASCATPADVGLAFGRARADGLAVAIRSGGHAVARESVNDDGLVIDVRPMKTIAIDPAARRARVRAGCTWGEFDGAAQVYGLATTGGRVSTTGVSGLTLGGGSGWLERVHGLSCDNLLAVEMVTADGRELRADQHTNSELLWACKGGGGNFGVVTALEFALLPVGPMVLGGLVAWPADHGQAIARLYRDMAFDAPAEFASGLVLLSGPPEPFIPADLQGQPTVAVAVV
jgi:FAD/FMN-containing dehydrogenase